MPVRKRIRQLIRSISDYSVPLYAANAAFYLILSFFPAILLILSLLPYIGYSEADLLQAMESITPNVLHLFLESIIQDMSQKTTGALISMTAVIAVWSSSRSVYSIQKGLNAICGVSEDRGYFFRRAVNALYMLLLLAAFLLTFVLHSFGQEIIAYCEKQPIPILQFLVRLFRFRGLLLLFVLSALFTAFYCILPNRKFSVRSALPGGILAALGWQLFTYFFSLYVRRSGTYSLFYGSLTGIALGMLWLFVCLSILFYGCVLNLFLERRRKK